jgi:hypothetical protein
MRGSWCGTCDPGGSGCDKPLLALQGIEVGSVAHLCPRPRKKGAPALVDFTIGIPPRIEGLEYGLEVTAAALFRADTRIDTGGLRVGMTQGGNGASDERTARLSQDWNTGADVGASPRLANRRAAITLGGSTSRLSLPLPTIESWASRSLICGSESYAVAVTRSCAKPRQQHRG